MYIILRELFYDGFDDAALTAIRKVHVYSLAFLQVEICRVNAVEAEITNLRPPAQKVDGSGVGGACWLRAFLRLIPL